MRLMLCIAAVAALGAAPALAHEPAKAANAPAIAKNAVSSEAGRAPREVYVCDSSAMTKRGFAREFGSSEYVTADQAAKAESWAAPRCMTKAEARKLKQLASAR